MRDQINAFMRRRLEARRPRNMAVSQREFEAGTAIVRSTPPLVNVESTTHCNLKCVICEHGNRKIPLKAHMGDDLVEKLSPFLGRAVSLQLFGLGEPLLSPSFWKLLGRLKGETGIWISVNSNGTLLTPERIEQILDSPLSELNISFDAARADTYQKIRGGDFEKVVNNVRELVARRNRRRPHPLRILANMTLMKENVAELPEFVELAAELGVDQIFFWHLHDIEKNLAWTSRKGDWTFVYRDQVLRKTPKLANQMIERAMRRAEELGISVLKDRNKPIFLEETQ